MKSLALHHMSYTAISLSFARKPVRKVSVNARVTYERALKDFSRFARLLMPAQLTARGFAYHVRMLMDAHVALSRSFPCFSLPIFEQKRDCLQFTYEFALTRVWQATLENEELGKKEELYQIPD